jgi:hypothetical protein
MEESKLIDIRWGCSKTSVFGTTSAKKTEIIRRNNGYC